MLRVKLWVVLVREFGPMMIKLDLSQLSWRKLAYIQVFNFRKAFFQSGGGCCDGFGGDLDLNSTAMKAETMTVDNIAKSEDVEDEEERAKHRTPGDTLGQRDNEGETVVDMDKMSVGKVRCEPG